MRHAMPGRRGVWFLGALVAAFAAIAAAALAASTRFVEARWSPVSTGYFPQAVAEADFNGDGRRDLAVADTHDNPTSASTVTILPTSRLGPRSPTT